jgi:hypothetical protein
MDRSEGLVRRRPAVAMPPSCEQSRYGEPNVRARIPASLATKVKELIQSGGRQGHCYDMATFNPSTGKGIAEKRRRKLRLTNRGLDPNEDEADATWQPSFA